MKKDMSNKAMLTDIRAAKSNIFDTKAIDNLKANLGSQWKPQESLHTQQLKNVDILRIEGTKLPKDNEFTDLATQSQKKIVSLVTEENYQFKLAHYLIEASTLAEITTSLKKAVDGKDAQKTKELLKKFKKSLKTLPMRTEEDQEIFKQLETQLLPLLATIRKTTDHPHLITDAENILYMITQKQTPHKWKHAA